jgi:hypothetical protein
MTSAGIKNFYISEEDLEMRIGNPENRVHFLENCDDLFDMVFKEEIPDEINVGNPNDHFELEELNPTDAIQISEYDAETYNWTSWVEKTYFYCCAVPKMTKTYLLFSIDWDDNWGSWVRLPLCAIKGVVSYEEASKLLLIKFAKESLDNAGDGLWADFLSPALMLLLNSLSLIVLQ